MEDDLRQWLRKLQSHTENCRAIIPIPAPNGLSRPQERQYQIIKGSLHHRLNCLPAMISSPAAGQQDIRGYGIIFTSNAAGLVAASEIGTRRKIPLFSLLPGELRIFLQRCPDTGHKYHAHLWSHFLEDLDSRTVRLARRYPLCDREKYWLHVEGIACGPGLARGSEHLWSWDGSEPKLLKKNLSHWSA